MNKQTGYSWASFLCIPSSGSSSVWSCRDLGRVISLHDIACCGWHLEVRIARLIESLVFTVRLDFSVLNFAVHIKKSSLYKFTSQPRTNKMVQLSRLGTRGGPWKMIWSDAEEDSEHEQVG